MTLKRKIEFPKGFLWGASMSSHQVEGGTQNQWTEWELSPQRLAQLEREGLIEKYGKDNFISGIAADHYRRYAEDFALARKLGHNAVRFSVEWSRIEPEEGRFDEKEIAHYRDVVKTVQSLGMEPFVTLWHWTEPLWFYRKGSFEHKKNIAYFERFCAKMAAELPTVRFWITLNEPEIYAGHGYYKGIWPPQKKNFPLAWKVFNHLITAHRRAYKKIKEVLPEAQVGTAETNIYFEAYRGQWWNVLLKKIADWLWNFYFFNGISGTQDFIGLNQYFHNRIRGWIGKNENHKMSDVGWELYPEAIYHVIKDLGRYGVPIYITENGLADTEDKHRAWFIKESLKYVHQAIAEGADVRGYLHWSLIDNFEWADGFWPHFGLVAVDRATQKRTPRPSALVFRDICVNNGFEIE